MSQYTHKSLIYGLTSSIPILPTSPEDIPAKIELLVKLAHSGYIITNPEVLLQADYTSASNSILNCISSTTKQATVFRNSFGSQLDLESYTYDDYLAIFAQYSITYDWESTFESVTNLSPAAILSQYKLDTAPLIPAYDKSTTKHITLFDRPAYEAYMLSLLESKAPLRLNQEKIIQSADWHELSSLNPTYYVKSTKSLVQLSQYKQGILPTISSIDELLRFILSVGTKPHDIDFNGQITSDMLKSVQFHLPTRMKKFILNWFNNQSVRPITEQLLVYEQFWKRLFHHSHWCSSAKFNHRYPVTKLILTILYSTDRSWTFNSRYQRALQSYDYSLAFEILTEKPGLLLRNIIMYCKYTTGTSIATTSDTKPAVVQSDASDQLRNQLPTILASAKPAIKTAIQLLEELHNPVHYEPIHSREVRGQLIHYITPIPAFDTALVSSVISTVSRYIMQTKQSANHNLGKVYIAPELQSIAVQYSGANSDEIALSGGFIPPNSTLPLPDGSIIRLGICWKDIGHGSCDIDLSSIFIRPKMSGPELANCYYGSPELRHNSQLIAVSSGDITSCDTDIYSAEFIDIDIDKAVDAGFTSLFNMVNMYRGKTFDKYDTHIFLSVITPAQRIKPSSTITIDLAKQDYAVSLPATSKNYLPFYIDLVDRTMTSLSINTPSTNYDNANSLLQSNLEAINNRNQHTSLASVLALTIPKSSITTSPDEADITIGTTSDYSINVLTNIEELQRIIF